MDLSLSDDQELLRETTERFVSAQCSVSKVREALGNPIAQHELIVRGASEIGWFGLFVPEAFGGGSASGSPIADAVIVAEERGRQLVPGPFVAPSIVACAIAANGSNRQQAAYLPGIASGSISASWVLGGRDAVPVPAVTAVPRSGGFQLHGTAGLVTDAESSDLYLVSACGEGGCTQFLLSPTTPGISVVPRTGLDLTRSFADVTFDAVEVDESAVLGSADNGRSAVQRLLDVAIVLSLAESVGAMTSLLAMTVEYAKDRVAFGRPIGSFQAVKHMLADSSLSVEIAKAAAVSAAKAVGGERADAHEIASIAKSYIGDAGMALAQTCFQVHGGIGFTWEHDLHLYMRRLTADRALFGDPSWHRERICSIHGL